MFVSDILESNGWRLRKFGNEHETDVYELTVTCEYNVTCVAQICESRKNLRIFGDYGVMMLDAALEYDPPYGFDDLEYFKGGLILAEDNLLRIGAPFARDFEFHGPNTANKKRRNDKLRRDLCIEEMIQRDRKILQELDDQKRQREAGRGA